MGVGGVAVLVNSMSWRDFNVVVNEAELLERRTSVQCVKIELE